MTTKEKETLAELYRIRDNLSTYTDYEKLIEVLRPLLPSVPITMDGFENQPFYLDRGSQGNFIYRAMPLDEGGKRWDHEEEISYLPKKDLHKSKLNRANRQGDRVFYGSVHPLAAMIETYASGYYLDRVLEGKTHECVIGVWQVTTPITFASVPFSESAVTRLLAKRTFVPDEGNPITAEKVKASLDHLKRILNDEFKYKVIEFFADAFANEDNAQYLLSSYYAERVFDKVNGYRTDRLLPEKQEGAIEGVFYNAIPSSFEKRNVALLPNIVDTKLKLRSVMHYLTKFNKDNPIPFFVPLAHNIPVRDGVIQWVGDRPVTS